MTSRTLVQLLRRSTLRSLLAAAMAAVVAATAITASAATEPVSNPRILVHYDLAAGQQPENVASWRVMEKLGMRREAHFRQALHQATGEWWDEYFYALLADEHGAASVPSDGRA